MYAGGMAQRSIEAAVEQALGPCVLAKSASRDITDRLTPEDDAFWPRERSGSDIVSLGIDAVYKS